MPEGKPRVGFSLDFKDSKQQIDALVKSLGKVKGGFKETGKEGEASLNRINLGLKSVFKNISTMSANLRKGISDGQKMSRKQLKETLNQAKALENRISQIHSKTSQKFEQAEGRKRSALRATMKAQNRALKEVQKVGEASTQAIKKQEAGYGALAAILAVKVSSALRSVVKESTLLAARNEVLGTAMMTVGNNAGISNAELGRTEATVRKLGISINDTRELISRFAQAQLSMTDATRLARASQDLAAGSTLGSSEALRIMTQSILSLLPRQLRQFGVVVNLNQVYQEQSRILGKSVNDLTSLEKRQGLLNKIFEEASKRAGAYERSMEDAGKVLTTLSSRIIPDTLSMIGDSFLPVLEALVFGFKDLLEWVQAQDGGLKTFIATIIAVGAAVTTVVGAFTLFSGIVGAATGGFTGFSAAAASTLAGLGPLAIAIGAVTAALVLLPKLFEDTATAQEKALETSKGMLNIEIDRLSSLEDLKAVIADQSVKEEELRKIIQNNAKAHKELIPFLNKETISREKLLGVLDEEILKSKEILEIAKERAGVAAENQLKALEEQQKQTNSLVIALDKLQKKYGEGKVPILVLAGALKVFQDGIEASGGSIDNAADAMRDFADENDGGMQNLIRASQTLGERIRGLKRDVETEFGTAAKSTQQSASDMQQALLGLEAGYDKLAKKALKKLPFAALAKEQEEALERVDVALQSGLITQEQASDQRLRVQAVFQERFRVAELKFQQQLDSIGQSALQKIEAKRQRALEINQGSAVAIEAIEKQAAAERGAIYDKMWADRLSVIRESTEAIAQVIQTQRELDTASLQQEADMLLAGERTTAEERVTIRQDFHDKALALLENSQKEELNVRQQHSAAVALGIQELFNAGIINEEQFNTRSKALATDLKTFRQQQINERVAFLKSALNEMYAEEVAATERLKQLEQNRTQAARSTEDTVRKLRQEGLSDFKVFTEERQRANELLSEGETALQENNFERVKEINDEVKSIATATSKAISASAKEGADSAISADQARIGSIELVQQAGELLQQSFEAQRASEETALEKVRSKIDEIKVSLDALLQEKKEIEISIVGEAEAQIAAIQERLDSLQDKDVTVTVTTRNVTVGGGDVGITKGGAGAAAGGPIAEGLEGFAKGAVDIQGPGNSVSDSIVALLSRGESVISAAATQMFGPILEAMNTDPEKLRGLLAPKLSVAGAGAVAGNVSNDMTVGNVNITLNGVDSKDVQNINWRKVVRKEIAPELKKLGVRKAKI